MEFQSVEFRILVNIREDKSASVLVRSDTQDAPFLVWRTAAEYLLYMVAKKAVALDPDLDMEAAFCKLCQGAQQCTEEVIPNEILTLRRGIIEDEEPE